MEGDSVTLNTDLTEIQEDDDILWRFGAENSLIARISRADGIFSTFDVPDGRFRDRLKLDHQTGSLTITNITTEHDGDYKLEITGAKESSKTFNVSVYVSTQSPSAPPVSVSLIVLISASAGSLLFVAAVVGIFYICRKCRKTDQEVETHDEEITYAETTFKKRKAQKLKVKEEHDVVYAGVAMR